MSKQNNPKGARLTGVISISSKGTGYVDVDKKDKLPGKKDPEIDYKHLRTALHGDTVQIVLHPKGRGRASGEVVKIVSRKKTKFAGTVEKEGGFYFLKPDDRKMYTDILIPAKKLKKAKPGNKVLVEITKWDNYRKSPEGRVLDILGQSGEHNAEMKAIAIEKGFSEDFPKKVLHEAKKIREKGIEPEEYENRRDFRDILTFTIDPADAKDFDDAISFERDGKYFNIGIHIADVSHYVTPGSALDEEAKTRATSVYLVDRTIPMLPEALSNDLCSLVPEEDRLAMSAVFKIDRTGKIYDKWFGRSVINSNKRFAYEEANESLEQKKGSYYEELAILNEIAKNLNKKRLANGAISLDQEEVKFVLDENGVPIKVIKKSRGDANKLIEEFMLLANRKIAEKMSKSIERGKVKKGTFIYRIHDLPSGERMEDLVFFLKTLGYKVSLVDGAIPSKQLNKILKDVAGKAEEDAVYRAVIRSMAKAIYSTKNIGHYGLAFDHYAHFTSPIRRYPDISVHRMLMRELAGENMKNEKAKKYEEIAEISSKQEKEATEAERSSIKYKQVEYMSHHMDEEFEGVISGVSEWGVYVEELQTKSEGMVRMRDLDDDFYTFHEKRLEITGEDKKKSYRLGDRVKIKVKKVDLEKKMIDYIMI